LTPMIYDLHVPCYIMIFQRFEKVDRAILTILLTIRGVRELLKKGISRVTVSISFAQRTEFTESLLVAVKH
jgi:hypothetical protein